MLARPVWFLRPKGRDHADQGRQGRKDDADQSHTEDCLSPNPQEAFENKDNDNNADPALIAASTVGRDGTVGLRSSGGSECGPNGK